MNTNSSKLVSDTEHHEGDVLSHTTGLNLEISFEPSTTTVKLYNLVPDVGKVQGFGTNKEHRSSLIKVLDRQQLSRQDGIYLLFRRMEITYVGISQNIRDRLNTHNTKKKDEHDWDRAIIFYAKTPIMNGSIAGYAEHTLYLQLMGRGFMLLQEPPSERYLNSRDQIVARWVVSEILRMLDLLDLSRPIQDVREQQQVTQTNRTAAHQNAQQDIAALGSLELSGPEGIEVELTERGVRAVGRYTAFGLEVYAGSKGKARLQEHMERQQSFVRMRRELQDSGIIRMDSDGVLRFVQSYTFSSPTAASRILCGSNAPGPLVWKRSSDKTPLVKLIKSQRT